MATLCELCKKRPAGFPDRDTMSVHKKVCRACHADRLASDLRVIARIHMEPVGHHRWSHDGPCEPGCYYETYAVKGQ